MDFFTSMQSTAPFPSLPKSPVQLFLIFAFAIVFCITVPRIGPLVILSVTAAISVILLIRDDQRVSTLKRAFFRPEIPFALWALFACLWSPDSDRTVLKALFWLATTLNVIIIAKKLHLADPDEVKAAARGIIVGLIIGGAYICVEIASRQTLTRFILTYLPELDRAVPGHAEIQDGVIVKLSGAHNTRASAVFCLFVCPALLAATLLFKGALRWAIYVVVAGLLATVFLHPRTHSQTSQLAIVVLATTVILGLISPVLSRWAVAIGFAAALFLIIPASIVMYSAGVHDNQNVFHSARARIVLWNNAAEEVLKRPIVGAGTNASRYLTVDRELRREVKESSVRINLGARLHPHNMYLQIWYELGAIGILALALLGFSVWSRLRDLPTSVSIFGTAHFAVCAAIMAPSYSFWQNWFQASLAVSVLALLLVATPGLRR